MLDYPPGHVDEVGRLFDSRAATWSAKYAPNGRLAGRLDLFAAILSWRLPAGGRLLDLGCGTGEIARTAAAAGLKVTACDISEKMLRSAISQDRDRAVEWVRLDVQWRELPFPSGTFDAVVASSVLEYVDEPGRVLGETARLLRPGGFAACTVPDPRHPIRWLESLAGAGSRTALASVAGRHWQRFERYMTYLRTSRQRYPARWWHALAEEAGLLPIVCPVGQARYSGLRLLVLGRQEDIGTRS